jgi:GNAT superfamily N-acetyltransferase
MTVEPYSDRYFLDVARLVDGFHKEAVGEFIGGFSVDSLIETIKTADHSNAFLMILDGSCQGMIYGTRFKHGASETMIYQEAMWYVEPAYRKHGVALLKEVKKILKSQGVSFMIMALLENSYADRLAKFYQRLGMKPMERHFMWAL